MSPRSLTRSPRWRWTAPAARALALALAAAPLSVAYRVHDPLNPGPTSGAPLFEPYHPGFVGEYGDPANPLRFRVNEGSPLGSTQPNIFAGVLPRQNCPGMTAADAEGVHYCSRREAGYCDRRSGTCFCFEGYAADDCSACQPTHTRNHTSGLCEPRRLCPADCSGAGTCDFFTGRCTCEPHRAGPDCSVAVCPLFHEFCVECDANRCLRCMDGYFVTDSPRRVPPTAENPLDFGVTLESWRDDVLRDADGNPIGCVSCTVFDPRCTVCNSTTCLECADPLLSSIRRSGRRRRDVPLPFDEFRRELARTLPFGTQSPFAFEEAEPFFHTRDAVHGRLLRDLEAARADALARDRVRTPEYNRLEPHQPPSSTPGHVDAAPAAYATRAKRHPADGDNTPVAFRNELENTGWEASDPAWFVRFDTEGRDAARNDRDPYAPQYARVRGPDAYDLLTSLGRSPIGTAPRATEEPWRVDPTQNPDETPLLGGPPVGVARDLWVSNASARLELEDAALACSQGQQRDAVWMCTPHPISHRVCGHPGTLHWAAPAYVVREDDPFLRVAVQRSGGGLGRVTVRYELIWGSASAADLSPAAPYAGAESAVPASTGYAGGSSMAPQTLVFEEGVVQLSFLLTVHDDLLLEGNETATLVLRDPTGGAVLGPQTAAAVLVIDDDRDRVLPTCTALTSPAGPSPDVVRLARSLTASTLAAPASPAFVDTTRNGVLPPTFRATAGELLPLFLHARRSATDRPCRLPGDADGLPPLTGAAHWALGNYSGAVPGDQRWVVELWDAPALADPRVLDASHPVRSASVAQRVGLRRGRSGDAADSGELDRTLRAADSAVVDVADAFGSQPSVARLQGQRGAALDADGAGVAYEFAPAAGLGRTTQTGHLVDPWRRAGHEGFGARQDRGGGRGFHADDNDAATGVSFDAWTEAEAPTRGTYGYSDAGLAVGAGWGLADAAWGPGREAGRRRHRVLTARVQWAPAVAAADATEIAAAQFRLLEVAQEEEFPLVRLRRPSVPAAAPSGAAALLSDWTVESLSSGSSGTTNVSTLPVELVGGGADPSVYVATLTPEVAGDYVLYAWHAQPGGLRAEYFPNAVLRGPPLVTRVDHGVNFTWGEGPVASSHLADAASARWVGKVELPVVDRAAIWTQLVAAGVADPLPLVGDPTNPFVPVRLFVSGGVGDQVRVWFDQELVIDRWGGAYSTTGAAGLGGLGAGSSGDPASASRVQVTEERLSPEEASALGDSGFEREVGTTAWGLFAGTNANRSRPILRAYSESFLREALEENGNTTGLLRGDGRRGLADANVLVWMEPGRLHDIRIEWRDAGHPHAACRFEWQPPLAFERALRQNLAASPWARYASLVVDPGEDGDASASWADLAAAYPQNRRAAVPPSVLFSLRPIGDATTVGPFAPSWAVRVEPGLPDATRAVVEGWGAVRGIAGEPAFLTIRSRDAFGNDRLNRGAVDTFRAIAVLEGHTWEGLAGPPPSSTDGWAAGTTGWLGAAGAEVGVVEARVTWDATARVHRVEFTPTVAGPYLVYVQLWTDWREWTNVAGSPFPLRVFPAPVAAARCNISGSGLLGAEAGVPAPIELTARDQFGNPVPFRIETSRPFAWEPDRWDTQGRAGAFRETTLEDGFASFAPLFRIDSYHTAAQDELAAVNAFLQPTAPLALLSDDGTVDPTDPTPSSESPAPSDSTFFALAHFAGAFVPFRAGLTVVSVTLHGVHVEGSPVRITVVPAPTAGRRSLAEGESLRVMIATESHSFDALMRDAFDNPRPQSTGSDVLSLRIDPLLASSSSSSSPSSSSSSSSSSSLFPSSSLSWGLSANTTDVEDSVVFVGGDQYRLSVTPTAAGLRLLHVVVEGEEVQASPFRVRIFPGAAVASFALSAGEGLASAVTGVESSFVVQPRDGADNPTRIEALVNELPALTQSGTLSASFLGRLAAAVAAESVTATFTLVMAASGVWFGREAEFGPIPVNISRLSVEAGPGAVGWYRGTYTLFVAGNYSLEVLVNGAPIPGSPFDVVVAPNRLDAVTSVVWGDGLAPSATGLLVGETHHISLLARDPWGNDVLRGGEADRLLALRVPLALLSFDFARSPATPSGQLLYDPHADPARDSLHGSLRNLAGAVYTRIEAELAARCARTNELSAVPWADPRATAERGRLVDLVETLEVVDAGNGTYTANYVPTDAVPAVVWLLNLPSSTPDARAPGSGRQGGLLRRVFAHAGLVDEVDRALETEDVTSAPLTYQWGREVPTLVAPLPRGSAFLERQSFAVRWTGWLRVDATEVYTWALRASGASLVRFRLGQPFRSAQGANLFSAAAATTWVDGGVEGDVLAFQRAENEASHLFSLGTARVAPTSAYPPTPEDQTRAAGVREFVGSVRLEAGVFYPVEVVFESTIVASTPDVDRFVGVRWTRTSLAPTGATTYATMRPIPFAWLSRPFPECVTRTPAIVYSAPTAVDVRRSTVVGAGLADAVVNVTSHAVVELFDRFGNPRIQGGDDVWAEARLRRPRRVADELQDPSGFDPMDARTSTVLAVTTTPLFGATYLLSYSPVVAGTYLLDVTANAERAHPDLGPTARDASLADHHLPGSPFVLAVETGAALETECFTYGPGLVSGIAGETFQFVVQTVDPGGNNRTSPVPAGVGGVAVRVELLAPADARAPTALIRFQPAPPAVATYVADGRYDVTFSPTIAGEYAVHVLVGGRAIPGSPFPLSVASAILAQEQCFLEGAPVVNLTDHTLTFDVVAADRFGSRRARLLVEEPARLATNEAQRPQNDVFVVRVRGAGQPEGVDFEGAVTPTQITDTPQTDDEGRYRALVRAPVAGRFRVSTVVLSGNVLARRGGHGLAGLYFANSWLFGTPVWARVDAFQNPVGQALWRDDAASVAASRGATDPLQFASVRWTGFLRAPVSAEFRFRVTVRDAAGDAVEIAADPSVAAAARASASPSTLSFFAFNGSHAHVVRLGVGYPTRWVLEASPSVEPARQFALESRTPVVLAARNAYEIELEWRRAERVVGDGRGFRLRVEWQWRGSAAVQQLAWTPVPAEAWFPGADPVPGSPFEIDL